MNYSQVSKLGNEMHSSGLNQGMPYRKNISIGHRGLGEDDGGISGLWILDREQYPVKVHHILLKKEREREVYQAIAKEPKLEQSKSYKNNRNSS